MLANSDSNGGSDLGRAVILTALALEYSAVRLHLDELTEVTHPHGTVYEVGHFRGHDSRWEVLLGEIGPGNPGAAREVERAIGFFGPDVVFFVGVAGGIKDVKLGDVVAANKIYAYESGKASEEFLPRPNIGLADYGLEQRARAEARKGDWIQRINVPIDFRQQPRALVAPIAAGEKVISSTKSREFEVIRKLYSDAVAVEMEGVGFLQAAYASNVPGLVVRGISDLIDGKTEADALGTQVRAASYASAFAFEILSKWAPALGQRDIARPKVAWNIHLDATVENLNDDGINALLGVLRGVSHDATLTVSRVEKGSVVLVLSGSVEGAHRTLYLFDTGRLDTVGSYHTRSVNIDPESLLGKALALRTKGVVEVIEGNVQTAIALFKQALREFDAIGDHLGQAEALTSLADALLRQTEYAQAIGYCMTAVELVRTTDDHLIHADTLLAQARTLALSRQLQLALEAYIQAAAIFQECQDNRAWAYAIAYQGEINLALGNSEKAEALFRRAHVFLSEERDGPTRSIIRKYLQEAEGKSVGELLVGGTERLGDMRSGPAAAKGASAKGRDARSPLK
ncbi:MAG TPA: tetratricopeptide repeat protein [Symbiobacteriaceae bacterium]|nr:tetratricopeptide repeat protein [Symbiobacteriaceae bacterium]